MVATSHKGSANTDAIFANWATWECLLLNFVRAHVPYTVETSET